MQSSKYVFQEVTDEDLLTLLKNGTPINTKKANETWYRKFTTYLATKSVDPNTAWFETSVNKKLLSISLQKFVVAQRKQGGQESKASSIQTILHSVYRQLKIVYPDCGVDFFRDPMFTNVSSILDSKMKQLQANGLGEADQARSLTPEEFQRLANFLNPDDADGLIMLVAIYLSYFCSYRGQQLVDVKRDFLEKKESPQGTWYRYLIPVEKNRQGGSNGTYMPRYGKIPPDCDQDGLRFQPVALISKYLDKSMPGKDGRLFVHKNQSWKSSTLWYSKKVIGINWFRDQLKVAAQAVSIEGKVTWHSFRATGATNLSNSGVSEQFVKGFTGHRSDAVRSYRRIQEEQELAVAKLAKSALFSNGQQVVEIPLAQLMNENQPTLVHQQTTCNNVNSNQVQVCNALPQQFSQLNVRDGISDITQPGVPDPIYNAPPPPSDNILPAQHQFAQVDKVTSDEFRMTRKRQGDSVVISDARRVRTNYQTRNQNHDNSNNKVILAGNGNTYNLTLNFNN
ncbi:hypothetical protein MP228_009836 [Amoeboaphelidium protococcarum]|nr:hypothetical protein MP228_009836 [Amoeboaphelidium protococcarum]